MTSFARTPEGRAAAERMMKEFGHTMGPFKPRPGFPGRSPATPQALVAQPPAAAGLGSMPANSRQLGQMQGMLQGTPVGGPVGRAQIAQELAQPPAPARGFGGLRRAMDARNNPAPQTAQTGATQANPPSFASQMGALGGVGTGLQQMFGNKSAGMKKGGAVSKADMKKAGFYDKGKTKSERQKIVSKVTTKPQRIAMVEKAFSTKNMKSGGTVSSASKRADGCATKGKTRCKIV